MKSGRHLDGPGKLGENIRQRETGQCGSLPRDSPGGIPMPPCRFLMIIFGAGILSAATLAAQTPAPIGKLTGASIASAIHCRPGALPHRHHAVADRSGAPGRRRLRRWPARCRRQRLDARRLGNGRRQAGAALALAARRQRRPPRARLHAGRQGAGLQLAVAEITVRYRPRLRRRRSGNRQRGLLLAHRPRRQDGDSAKPSPTTPITRSSASSCPAVRYATAGCSCLNPRYGKA